jgi:hypothetical protein
MPKNEKWNKSSRHNNTNISIHAWMSRIAHSKSCIT